MQLPSLDPAVPEPLPATNAWWLAVRPKTLPAAVVGVLVGCACGIHAGSLRVGPSVAALLGALLLQIGSNFANDVFDFEKGADTAERVGPTRAVQAGLISAGDMKRGMLLVLSLAVLVGLYLTWTAGLWIVGVGTLSILAAVAYTGGPYPLGYHGLGELFVFVFFGLTSVCATTYLNAASLGPIAPWLAVSVGALTSAILVVNNVRDHETDAKSGKRTLIVRFGRAAGIVEYYALLALAYAGSPLLVATGVLGPWALLPLLSVPWALRLCAELRRETGVRLNATLAGTAKLLLVFGLLQSAGVVLDVQH
jgi:1,4-dihydroxy-2-naphthoate polyprenyltransferase